MGVNQSCPAGFEDGLLFSCRATCPPEFKYIQEGGNMERCVSIRRNDRSFSLNRLPRADKDEPLPTIFKEETDRVVSERERVLGEIDKDDINRKLLNESRDSIKDSIQSFSKIQTDFAVFNERKTLVDEIKKANESLEPMRPPTAPSSDLEFERRQITEIAKRNLFFVQIALFLVVLVMLSYIALPFNTANLIAFALLCLGIAMGFFLRR
jgi:hypothetical protein